MIAVPGPHDDILDRLRGELLDLVDLPLYFRDISHGIKQNHAGMWTCGKSLSLKPRSNRPPFAGSLRFSPVRTTFRDASRASRFCPGRIACADASVARL